MEELRKYALDRALEMYRTSFMVEPVGVNNILETAESFYSFVVTDPDEVV